LAAENRIRICETPREIADKAALQEISQLLARYEARLCGSEIDPFSLPVLRAALAFPRADDFFRDPATIEEAGLRANTLVIDQAFHTTG
jgi:hypothetical protein